MTKTLPFVLPPTLVANGTSRMRLHSLKKLLVFAIESPPTERLQSSWALRYYNASPIIQSFLMAKGGRSKQRKKQKNGTETQARPHDQIRRNKVMKDKLKKQEKAEKC